jgi:tape measure domain-containing protein
MGVLYEAWADVVYREDTRSKAKVKKDVIAFAKQLSDSFTIKPSVDDVKFRKQLKDVENKSKANPISVTAELEAKKLDNDLKRLRVEQQSRKLSIPFDAELAELEQKARKLRLEQKLNPVDIPFTADTSKIVGEVEAIRSVAKMPVDIPITADTSKFITELAIVSSAGTNVGNSFVSSFAGSIKSGSALVGKAIAGVTAGAGIAGGLFGAFAVKSTADLEKTSIGIQQIVGDVKVANSILADTKKLSDSTPFGFTELAETSKTLLGYGIAADDVFEKTKQVAAASAKYGSDLGGLSVVLGQVSASGKLMGQDALQLVNNGIPLYGLLGDQMGVTAGEAKKLAEEGKVSSEILFQALNKGVGDADATLNAFGQTFEGRVSTFQDSFKNLGLAFAGVDQTFSGEKLVKEGSFFQIVTDSVKGLSTALADPALMSAVEGIGTAFGGAFKSLVDTFVKVLPTLAPILQSVADILGTVFDVIGDVIGDNSVQFVTFFQDIASAVKDIAPAVTAFADIFTDIFAEFGDIIKDIAPVVGDFFKNIFTAIKPIIPVLGSLAKSFLSLFKPLLPIISSVIEAFAPFIAKIGGSLVKALDGIGKVLADVFGRKETQEAITKLASTMGELAVVFVEELLPVLLNPAMVETFTTLVVDLLPVLTSLLTVLIPIIRVGGEVMQGMSAAIGWVVQMVAELIGWLGGIFVATIDAVVGVVSNLGTVWSTIWEGIKGVFSSVKDFLITGFTFIVESVGGFVSGIVNFFTGLPGRIITGLGNIGSTIWTFLSGAFDTVKRNVSNWIDGIVRFFYNLPGRIVGVLSSLGERVGKIFKEAMKLIVSPINLIIKGVNSVVGLLPGKQATIPLIQFHTGGIVGETKAKPHTGGGRLSNDEMLAVVQRGETILPTSVSKNLSRKEANMLVDGRFDDFAHSISGKKDVNQKEAQSIDYRLLAQNLKMLRGEYGFGFGDIVSGLKNIGGKAVDLARLVSGEVLAKSFDVAISPLKGLLSPLGFPGDMALGLATKMRNVAVDFVKGVKDEADKQGIFKASGEYSLFNSNLIAAEAAKNITPALLNKVVAAQGKSGSWKVLREYIQATKIPHVITSTVRPGAVTASGNISNHSAGRAIDVAGMRPSIDSKALGDIFWAFMPIGKLLNELIYAGPQVAKNIKRGLLVPKYAQSIHHNHVHAALHTGGMVGRDGFASRGFNPRSEMMMKLEKGEYVINKNAVNQIGVDNLDRLNNGETINYNSSGGGDTIKIYGVSPEQVLAEIEVRKQLKKSRMVI